MNTTTERLVGQVEGLEDIELVELGEVSEETKGGWVGSIQDGGFGRTFY